ncbi:MAG: hypothetical protein K8U57_30495 [Planctomycetes bacterium]|nr:hypothetical protein [Planctomycetota bacterium]
MTRDISSANQTASQATTIHPVLFVDLMFDDGAVRFHSELGDITWGGNTYTGTGRLGGLSAMEEESELARSPLSMTLSGLPTDLLSVLLNQQYQGRKATVYLGYLNLTTRVLVDDPFILHRGRMDTPQVQQGEDLTIRLSVDSRFAAWDRPLSRRYNNADQQSLYPGDRGLEFVEQSVEKQIAWGMRL